MSQRILITGGLGYVGGRVAQYLAQNTSYNLRLGSRSSTQSPAWLNNGEVVSMNLFDMASLEKACRDVVHIIHFAALNEIESLNDPEQALLINGLGSLKLLKAAIQADVKRFIYFSTAHVYGSPLEGTLSENSIPRPQHPYAISHRTAEDFVLSAKDKGEIEGIVVRLSNGIGAPERPEVNRWTLLVNDLCKQAVCQKKLILRSSGLQKRDFITLTDVGRAMGHLLELPDQACGNGLFNLGGENSMLVIEIAKKIADRAEKVLGFKPEIQRPNPSPGELPGFLDFRIDKLKATEFSLLGNVNEEIDDTLRLCFRAFGNICK